MNRKEENQLHKQVILKRLRDCIDQLEKNGFTGCENYDTDPYIYEYPDKNQWIYQCQSI